VVNAGSRSRSELGMSKKILPHSKVCLPKHPCHFAKLSRKVEHPTSANPARRKDNPPKSPIAANHHHQPSRSFTTTTTATTTPTEATRRRPRPLTRPPWPPEHGSPRRSANAKRPSPTPNQKHHSQPPRAPHPVSSPFPLPFLFSHPTNPPLSQNSKRPPLRRIQTLRPHPQPDPHPGRPPKPPRQQPSLQRPGAAKARSHRAGARRDKHNRLVHAHDASKVAQGRRLRAQGPQPRGGQALAVQQPARGGHRGHDGIQPR
jgi:hypothetical protein